MAQLKAGITAYSLNGAGKRTGLDFVLPSGVVDESHVAELNTHFEQQARVGTDGETVGQEYELTVEGRDPLSIKVREHAANAGFKMPGLRSLLQRTKDDAPASGD